MWQENESSKDSNMIASALSDCLKVRLQDKVGRSRGLRLFSDSCFGQNNNMNMIRSSGDSFSAWQKPVAPALWLTMQAIRCRCRVIHAHALSLSLTHTVYLSHTHTLTLSPLTHSKHISHTHYVICFVYSRQWSYSLRVWQLTECQCITEWLAYWISLSLLYITNYKLNSDLSHTQLYTSIMMSEMCSLHLTHPSAHTPGAVGSGQWCPGSILGVRCLAQGSHFSRGRARIRTHNLELPRVSRLPLNYF